MDSTNSNQPTTPQTPTPQPTPPGVFPSPATPAAAPAANDQNPAYLQNPTVTNQPTQPQHPSWHARVFDSILKGMTGGDRKVVNPDGTVSTIPSSRADMGKAIIAAALTGLMTPTRYRETPYGPTIDYSGSMSEAAQRGQAAMQQWRNAPQQLSDEQQARKLQFLKNNADLVHLQLASAHAQHDNYQQQIADAKPFMDSLHQYDQERDPSAPQAILTEGLTHQEALDYANAHPEAGVTSANYIPTDVWKPVVIDAQGHTEMQPTYAVINPALDKLKVTPEIAEKLSAVNPTFDKIHDKVGGDVHIPQSMWVSAWHSYSNLQRVNQALTRLNKSLNGENAADVDVSNIVRANKSLVPALGNFVQLLSNPENGGGENPQTELWGLTQFAPQFLDKLGMTPQQAVDKATDLEAQRVAKLTAAKNLGSNKQLLDDATVNGLINAAKQLPEDQQKTVLPVLQSGNVTKADGAKAQTLISGYQKSNQAKALQNGDPTVAAQTAKNILGGAYANVKDLASMRGNARETLQNAVIAEAQRRGLDISKWGEAALTTKTNMYREYRDTNKNKVGANIVAFRTFLDHADDALQANDTWRRANSPLLNKPWSWLAQNATNDPAYTQFVTALQPVKKEFMSFLNANRAEHEADIKTMDTVLSENSTPAQIETALKTLAKSADKRLAELASSYNSTMGVTMPEMLTPKAKDILNRMGTNSEAIPLTVALPKGNGQKLQDPTPFMQAAGGDKVLAREIAKQAGWVF